MGKRDPRLDAYIAKSADFARPVLTYLRDVVHEGCPDVVEELKWSSPHFNYKGMFCGMAAFKAHCMFGFWKHDVLAARLKGPQRQALEAMGRFGRLATLEELPSRKTILAIVREAVRVNDEGIKNPARKVTPKVDRVLKVPTWFTAAVRKNKKALKVFEAASYSFRREYVEWAVDAKGAETRARRLATAVEWIAEGKGRNWKYER